MNPEIALLRSALAEWEINIDDERLGMFNRYMELLLEWNEKMNLTAITDPEKIVIDHFIDSISPLKLNIIKNGQYVIDVGTGAGFPGLPLKIMMPEIKIVLLDSLSKRIKFLERVIEDLQLKELQIIHGRAEEYGQKEEFREKFDVVVSRAVAPLRVLTEFCIPFAKIDGYLISYKGPAADDELIQAQNAFKELKVDKVKIEEVDIPYSERQHKLIIIQKTAKTPNKYPRTPAKIKKSPL